jgi:hypothetical protein
MERLLTDRSLYEQLKSNARSSVESAFDINRTSEQLRRLFAREAP